MKNIIRLKLYKYLSILLLCFFACNLHSSTKDKTYVAKGNFGQIEISYTKLDSIISSLPFWKLNEYKTTDCKKSIAVQILKKEMLHRNQEIEKYLIIEIIENKDQSITFILNHINQYVYLYNLEHNKDSVPLTGNVTGVEGWYTVNLNTNQLKISYTQ